MASLSILRELGLGVVATDQSGMRRAVDTAPGSRPDARLGCGRSASSHVFIRSVTFFTRGNDSMLTTLIARIRGASAYRRLVAVLLAGCVLSFVLGQAAGHQPRPVVAAVTSPAQTVAVIAGSLSTPMAAPPHIVVPLSVTAPHAHHDGDGDNESQHTCGLGLLPAWPWSQHCDWPSGPHHNKGGPMPPIPVTISPTQAD